MRTTKYFLVKPAIAERAGVLSQRYQTADGLIVLNEQDMGRVRLQPEEYLTGVVEQVVDEREAQVLIEQGGRRLGFSPVSGEQTTGETVAASESATGDEPAAVSEAETTGEPEAASEENPEDASGNEEQECVTNSEAGEGLNDE